MYQQPTPQYIPTQAPQAVPQYMPSQVPQALPQYMPTQVPQGVPQYMPTQVPQGVPQYMPTQVPQGVPPQAPGVAPVASPQSVHPTAQQTPQQTAQQQWAQRLTSVARLLEQAIPGYQILISLTDTAIGTVAGQTLTGAESLQEALQLAVYHQFGALGAIRRFLCGDATSAVLMFLATAVVSLARVNSQIQPLLERVIMNLAPEQRSMLAGLAQTLATGDALMNQTAQAVQSMVGQQIWEAARSQVMGAAPQGASTTASPEV